MMEWLSQLKRSTLWLVLVPANRLKLVQAETCCSHHTTLVGLQSETWGSWTVGSGEKLVLSNPSPICVSWIQPWDQKVKLWIALYKGVLPTSSGSYHIHSYPFVSPLATQVDRIFQHPPSRLGAPNNLTSKTSSNSCSTFISVPLTFEVVIVSDWSGSFETCPTSFNDLVLACKRNIMNYSIQITTYEIWCQVSKEQSPGASFRVFKMFGSRAAMIQIERKIGRWHCSIQGNQRESQCPILIGLTPDS